MNRVDTTTRNTLDLADKAALIESYLPLVRWIAQSTVMRLPTTILVDDLVQIGIVGLMVAAKNYDENKGASFQTYAGIRIRGQILDEIRRNDWLPRSVYRRLRCISNASREISNKTGRAASAIDVAKKLGISLQEYHQVLADAINNQMFDYDDINDAQVNDKQINSFFVNPLLNAEISDSRKSLMNALEKLSKREQEVVSMYYFEEMNLKEIAKRFSVTESRVCQIHVKAVAKLRSQLSS